MKPKYSESELIESIENEMQRMLTEEVAPYAASRRIWEISFGHVQDFPDQMHPLWLIWGALTDWVEVRPDEGERADQEMLRASREWLALDKNDTQARDSYFHRWIYDILGYERESGPNHT